MLFSRKLHLYILSAIITVWAVYCCNPFAFYFQNDDFTNILLSSRHIVFQRNSFRPVCDISVMLDFMLWGRNAAGYHFTNLVLHTACSVLVFFFSRRIFRLYNPSEARSIFPFVAALLFFIYPMHSESVFWILGRSGTLGAVFALLFLLFFVKTVYRRIDVLAYAFFFTVALLTYESCWALPLVSMALLAGMKDGWRVVKQRRYHFLLLGIIFIVYLFFRWRQNNEILDEYEAQNFLQLNVVVLLQNFFQLFARSFVTYRQAPTVIQAGLIITALLVVFSFFRGRREERSRYLPVLLCFIICLLPCLSVGIDTHGTEGERYLYLPSVFMCLFIAMALCGLPAKSAVFAISFVCITYAAQLYVNASNYRFAGKIVKQTLDELAKAGNTKNIQVEQLPRAQYGALMLENGLPQAIELLGLPQDSTNITIQSQRSEIMPLQKPYKTVYLNGGNMVTRFVFTDTALLIYK